jgi:hypothetical protein
VQAADGTYGSFGRNALRNPGTSNFDTRISRAFPLHFKESANLQFLFEAFSALNHPQLVTPDNRLGRTTFGAITTATGSRVLQFGLKLGFYARSVQSGRSSYSYTFRSQRSNIHSHRST